MDSQTPTASPDIVDCPHARALFDWWQRASGDRAMPQRGDFLAECLAPWWSNLVFYDVVPIVRAQADAAFRFRFRVHGTNVVEFDGGDFTGKFLDAVLSPVAAPLILATYCDVVKVRLPLYSKITRPLPKGYAAKFNRLQLPFGDANGVTHVLAYVRRISTNVPAMCDLSAPSTPDISELRCFLRA